MTESKEAQTVQTLNELLLDELSMLETYAQALTLLPEGSDARPELLECQTSHDERVVRLREEILRRRGEPVDPSEARGAFPTPDHASKKDIGIRIAVSLLESAEERGLDEYQKRLPKLDLIARRIVSADFYSQQIRTLSIVAGLDGTLKGPAVTWWW